MHHILGYKVWLYVIVSGFIYMKILQVFKIKKVCKVVWVCILGCSKIDKIYYFVWYMK